MAQTKLVHSFLEDSVARFPEKKALFAGGKWETFVALENKANRIARLLAELGMKRGDRVALLIENSSEYVVSYYGILKAGGATVAINTENTREDVSFILRDCGIRSLITNYRFLTKALPLAPGEKIEAGTSNVSSLETALVWNAPKKIEGSDFGLPVVNLPEALDAVPNSESRVRVIDLDVASIVYTSGSTGKPRGAVLSHLNIVSNTRSIVDYLGLVSDDRVLAVLPFHYIYGKSLLNTHFYAGGSVVIDNRFLYPNVVLQTMREQEVTGFAGVPSTFTILLNRSNLKSLRFPSLRYVTQAGGAMPPSVQKDVAAVFFPARLFIMYGATEASARLSYLDPADLPRKLGSIGKPIDNVELFVATEDGRPLPPGIEGEIVARGSNLMSGYWNDPEETDRVLKNGLYYTGDIGRMDDEGFLYIVGRIKDMIKIGGNRVSSKEIEEALHEHPAVVEAAVIGVPDEILGETPKAFIVVEGSAGSSILMELPGFLQRRIAAYKIPKFYEIRETLPKNDAGKILKHKLR